MLRPTQIITLFYSRTRNGTNINFTAVFISMLNSRILIYKNFSHYSNSITEMFQWKREVIYQKQRMLFPRKRFKRKEIKETKNGHGEPHFSTFQNINFVSKTLSKPYSSAIPHLVCLFHFAFHRSSVISHQEMVAGYGGKIITQKTANIALLLPSVGRGCRLVRNPFLGNSLIGN